MNVDEAMRCVSAGQNSSRDGYAVLFNLEVGTTLKAEVERLRGDVDFHSEAFKGLIDYLAEKKAENDKLRAELAAVKAASVCPVELVALGDADWHCDVNVKCKSGEDADRLYNWLRDRMKERGEG